ncbi:N-acetylmuramoyl-L-alanine amidase [Paenibacillus sp. 481]|uniref:N-acetylmuramoyl-L-alanine amidase n=1 Tax=Paenibacillus sp. 481 TaxID=2835869 RepID=UPI001E505C0D|nr:N-acetylmuramoyl-L-alanine amidase [Paenibacillus sp. 481]UHA74450.1 N-acetylmuramoyl-L-alanine amidase [Paenibacillus sp. 481]
MVQIKQRLLPNGKSNKPNRFMTPSYVTIHNTDNTSVDADAEAHARYVINGSGGEKKSWHYTVDDREAYQHLRDDEQGWHAGSSKGNRCSIGIEICMNQGINEKSAWKNAAQLVAMLVRSHNIPLQHVVPHRHWSGKQCPSRILPHWDAFFNLIKEELKRVDKPQQKVTIEVNGVDIEDTMLVDGVAYAPVRDVAAALGASTTWDQKEKKVTVTK